MANVCETEGRGNAMGFIESVRKFANGQIAAVDVGCVLEEQAAPVFC